jgi:hypothetical protein
MLGAPVVNVSYVCQYCGMRGRSPGEVLHTTSCPRSGRSCATSSTGQTVVGYHATNASAAASIRAGGFRCGCSGLAGGGIYFATSEHDARRKSNHGNDVVLVCELALGRTLTLDQDGDPSMTLHKLNGMGCDSVRILRNGDEYVVYEPSRVRLLN